jgi:Uma2 family endonuclease
MAYPAATGYGVEDLDRLRDELGIAHIELDPWGSLIATPATDEHETVVAILNEQAVRQLPLPPGSIRVNGFAWKVPGGSCYTNVPDLAVLAPGWKRIDESHVSHPPLLIVEVTLPSTSAVERGRKLTDYRLGGAELFVVVEVPAHTTSGEVTFELHDFAAERVVPATASIDLVVGGQPVRFDLRSFSGAGS